MQFRRRTALSEGSSGGSSGINGSFAIGHVACFLRSPPCFVVEFWGFVTGVPVPDSVGFETLIIKFIVLKATAFHMLCVLDQRIQPSCAKHYCFCFY